MPGATPNRGFPYPNGSENISQGDDVIKTLAERADAEYVEGTSTARASISTFYKGRTYYETDTGDIYRDTGTAWRFERATARAEMTASGSSTTLTVGGTVNLSIATIANSVSGVFSVSGGNSIAVAPAGLYRVSFAANYVSGGAGATKITIDQQDVLAAGSVKTSYVTRLTAAGQWQAVGAQTGGSAANAQMFVLIIERVGP